MTICPKCNKPMENRGLVITDSKQVFSPFRCEYVRKFIWSKLLQCPKCSRLELEVADI